MPVKSSRSSVLVWPKREEVHRALTIWATALAEGQENVSAVGYFGSYAKGDHGVGSDLDLVVLLTHSDKPPERRALRWPLEALPVGADVLAYTLEEWQSGVQEGARMFKMLGATTVWVWGGAPHTESASS